MKRDRIVRAAFGAWLGLVCLSARARAEAPPLPPKALEKALYDKIAAEGGINPPGLPWAVQVRQVRGREMQFVYFLRRMPGATENEVVGRALRMELSVSPTDGAVSVRLRHAELSWADGTRAWCEDRALELGALPGWRFLKERAPARVSLPLTDEERSSLAKSWASARPGVEALERAFGPFADGLLREEVINAPGLGLVLAADRARLVGGKIVLSRCSVLRFGAPAGKRGNPILETVRDAQVSLSVEAYSDLVSGFPHGRPITLHLATGQRIVVGP